MKHGIITIIRVVALAVLVTVVACGGNASIDDLKKLGTDAFTPERWLGASPEARSRMLFDLVANHGVIGMTPTEVIRLLGKPTDYYEYDEFPAYQVGPLDPNQRHSYLVAFIMDRTTGKITHFVLKPRY